MGTTLRIAAIVSSLALWAAAHALGSRPETQSSPGSSPRSQPSAGSTPAPQPSAQGSAGAVSSPSPELMGVARIRRDAGRLEPLATTELARAFLRASAALPSIPPRTLHRDPNTKLLVSAAEMAKLDPAARTALKEVPIDEDRYYNTKYGSPLAYARPLEILAKNGFTRVAGRRILDFGYGSVGQLRLLASLGADAVGVDVDPWLAAVYAWPEDQGAVGKGKITLVDGRWPADGVARMKVGGGYDLILSKNTLKNGYLHPTQPVDKKMLVDLGVDDDAFVRNLHDALKPGGFLLIYNLSPAPSQPGEPYKPWADGRCPFPKEQLEAAGFTVLAFNVDDGERARAMGRALEWNQDMDLEADLFARYTLAVRRTVEGKTKKNG